MSGRVHLTIMDLASSYTDQRFLFFTKTRWDEPPRLRHQLAALLLDAGCQVLFFEKPSAIWQRRGAVSKRAAERLTILHSQELLHHKLRLNRVLHAANAKIAVASIRRALEPFAPNSRDIIVNFNYEYYFLRGIFPSNRILTVINDDFVSRALFGYTAPARWALRRTCAESDRVLTVSVPLQQQLSQYCDVELFLPWADRPYCAPVCEGSRTHLLYWGYINDRIDFDAVHNLSQALLRSRPEMRLLFVGPVDSRGHAGLNSIRSLPNVQVTGPARLDELPLNSILAGLIPYRSGVPSIEATTLPNKALQLLARGLPLLISGMPHFIEGRFILRLNLSQVVDQVDMLRQEFHAFQTSIREFVEANDRKSRLAQFLAH